MSPPEMIATFATPRSELSSPTISSSIADLLSASVPSKSKTISVFMRAFRDESCARRRVPPYYTQMCRNIRPLLNFDPPATDDEVRAASVQFVRKLSGFAKPSQANEAAFDRAVEDVTAAAHRLLTSLHTHAPARDRAIEAEKAKERSRSRFG